MNNKLIVLLLPLFFFACESDEEDANESLAGGTWTVNSIMAYPDSETCDGSLAIEILTEGYGFSFAFTDAGDVTAINTFNLSADTLCAGWDGVLINGGADCFDEAMLNDYTGADTAYATVSMDTLCDWWDGDYSNNFCSGTESQISEYSTDGGVLTLTHYSGTDSSEVETGTYIIDGNQLTLDMVETEDDEGTTYSTCYKYSAQK
jgi:hypothetical protein